MQNNIFKGKNLILSLGVITFIAVATISCSKATVDATGTGTTAFEHATMKPWFDSYCGNCHASGKSNARDWLYNAANYESIKANIKTIYSDVYTKKSMPQGSKLSATELQKFKDWYDAGYPAK